MVSLAVIVWWPKKLGRRVSGSIVAVALGMVMVSLLHWPVETIGIKYHGTPQGLPVLAVPVVNWRMLDALSWWRRRSRRTSRW